MLDKPLILFVDDEPAVLDGIRRSLHAKSANWDLVFLSEPLKALEFAKTSRVDVVVSDLRMPGMTGLELLGAMRDAGIVSQAIILTGTGDLDSAVQAINHIKVFRYYTKPCPASALAEGIEEALAVARRTEMLANPAALSALDALPMAALAVDADAKLLFANRRGGELLSSRDPIFLDGLGICRARLLGKDESLKDAIDGLTAEADAHVRVYALESQDGRRFSMLVEPPQNGAGEVAAILFLRPIDGLAPPSADELRRLFAFSPAEARLAHELAKGQDLKEAAEALGVTINTARTYLRVVFQKAGVNRQSELIRLIGAALAKD